MDADDRRPGRGDSGTLDGWSLEAATLTGAPQGTPVTITDPTTVAIPDGIQSGLVRSLSVADLGPFLTRARLVTTVIHAAPGQLEMFLTSPAGTTVTITTANGGSNANVFNGTSWEDLAGKLPVTNATYAASVAQSSLVPEEAMSAFIGENPNGTWTLTVLDTLGGTSGTLANWSLVLETGAAFNLRQTLTAATAGVPAGGNLVWTALTESTGPGDAPAAHAHAAAAVQPALHVARYAGRLDVHVARRGRHRHGDLHATHDAGSRNIQHPDRDDVSGPGNGRAHADHAHRHRPDHHRREHDRRQRGIGHCPGRLADHE